jgi:molybdate/tungstate transport system substrate-binding protein
MNIEKAFEKENPDIDVLRVIGGSRKLARMIVDVGKYADVYASADYTLIEEMLVPKFADRSYKFASNEMVICYTDKSKFANIINSGNWHKILQKDEVKFGHSEPNLDPCGYRTILLIKLAEKYYKIPDFFKNITENRNKIIVRPKETDLTPLLEQGFIDYLFIYRSIAVQHNFRYVSLPDNINLKNLKYNDFYSSVRVKLAGKKPGEYVYKKGKAIIYGITDLKMSKHPDIAKKFLNFVLDKNRGGKIIEECGQNFIYEKK